MSAQARTAGPWRVDRGNSIYAGGFKIGQTGGDYYDNGRADKSGFCVGLPTETNAAFIVQACNAHDDLVAALKDVLRIAMAASIGVSGNQPRLERARAALAKVAP